MNRSECTFRGAGGIRCNPEGPLSEPATCVVLAARIVRGNPELLANLDARQRNSLDAAQACAEELCPFMTTLSRLARLGQPHERTT
jgi:hypothetical protein